MPVATHQHQAAGGAAGIQTAGGFQSNVLARENDRTTGTVGPASGNRAIGHDSTTCSHRYGSSRKAAAELNTGCSPLRCTDVGRETVAAGRKNDIAAIAGYACR